MPFLFAKVACFFLRILEMQMNKININIPLTAQRYSLHFRIYILPVFYSMEKSDIISPLQFFNIFHSTVYPEHLFMSKIFHTLKKLLHLSLPPFIYTIPH